MSNRDSHAPCVADRDPRRGWSQTADAANVGIVAVRASRSRARRWRCFATPRCTWGRQVGGSVDGGGEPVAVDPVVVEQAVCDGQHTHVGRRAAQTIAPAVRREVMRRDRGRCRVPGCRAAAWVDVHHIVPKSCGGTHEAENLVVVCGLCRARHKAHYADWQIMPRWLSAPTETPVLCAA